MLITIYNLFINEKLNILKGPSDEECDKALKNLNPDQILQKTMHYGLGEYGFEKAVEAGLIDELNNNMDKLLMKACSYGSLKYVKYAIENGADINFEFLPNNVKTTPLIYASIGGHLEIVKYLIDMGVDINHVTITGGTALSNSINYNHQDVTEFLKSKGAK